MECTKEETVQVICTSKLDCLVWKPDDVLKLRKRFRIVGNLIGGLPQFQQQNVFNGIPLVLSKEEVTLLLSLKAITLIDDSVSYSKPTEIDVKEFKDKRNNDFENQKKQLEIEKARKNEIYSTKKRKQPDSSETNENKKEEKPKHADNYQGSELITFDTITSRKRAQKDATWKYPTTEMEHARYRVFEDLWKKGFYLSNGSKFGGDFLAYPGEPLNYHAHYVVIVKLIREVVSPLDIISYGRLGVTVKKSPVIASVDQRGESEYIIRYVTIDWQGVT